MQPPLVLTDPCTVRHVAPTTGFSQTLRVRAHSSSLLETHHATRSTFWRATLALPLQPRHMRIRE